MKTTNTISTKENYVSPRARVFNVAPQTIICLSIESGSVQSLDFDEEE